MDNKLAKVRALLDENGVDGILVESQPNFHWLTGGRGFIGLNSESACATLLITKNDSFLLSNNIEGKRLVAEELKSRFELVEFPWYDESRKEAKIKELCPGRVARDAELARRFMTLRTILDAEQIAAYQDMAPTIASILERNLRAIKKGVSELAFAGALSADLWEEGIEPVTILVGFDDRLAQWRHLLPTRNLLNKRAIASLAVRRNGLFVSVTRQICFGSIPEEIQRKQEAVDCVKAKMLASTRAGKTMGELLDVAIAAYAEAGFPEEWRNHHQGGLTGYVSRESRAHPGSTVEIKNNQAFAWNPTIAGVKAEETAILHDDVIRIVTDTGDWPRKEYAGVSLPEIITL